MPTEQRYILLNIFLFFSIVINILPPSKLDNDFIRPITFQPGTILNVWRVNRHVQVIKGFEGSALHIIFSYTVCNTGDIYHSRLEYWPLHQHCLSNATTLSCNFSLTFLKQTTPIQFFSIFYEVHSGLC